MMVFACTNVAHCVLDIIAFPRSAQALHASTLIAEGFYQSEYKIFGRSCLCLLLSLLCIQVFNQCLHFIYRYIVFCRYDGAHIFIVYRPHQSFLLKKRNLTLILIIIIPLLGGYEFAVAYSQPFLVAECPFLLAEILRSSYNSSVEHTVGILFIFSSEIQGPTSYSVNGFYFGCFLFGPFFVLFQIMIFCAYRTHKAVARASFRMSSVTQNQNRLFYYMIVVQSLIPVVLLHIPGMILFFASIFTVLSKEQLDALMMISLTCPTIEPLVVIYFLSKGKLKRFFRCSKKNKYPASTIAPTRTPQSALVEG